jgi:hypothetical protein
MLLNGTVVYTLLLLMVLQWEEYACLAAHVSMCKGRWQCYEKAGYIFRRCVDDALMGVSLLSCWSTVQFNAVLCACTLNLQGLVAVAR